MYIEIVPNRKSRPAILLRDGWHEGRTVRKRTLAQVERLFRSLKGLRDLIRPIRHREERRVRAHIFLCLLAGYLEWHLRRAWAPLLFDDESLAQHRKTRDPVALARPTPEAKRKKATRRTEDGLPLHSLDTLIAELAHRATAHPAHRNTTPRPKPDRHVPSADTRLSPILRLKSMSYAF